MQSREVFQETFELIIFLFDFQLFQKQRKPKNQHQPHGSEEPQESVEDNDVAGQKSLPEEEEQNNNKPYVVRHSDVWGR